MKLIAGTPRQFSQYLAICFAVLDLIGGGIVIHRHMRRLAQLPAEPILGTLTETPLSERDLARTKAERQRAFERFKSGRTFSEQRKVAEAEVEYTAALATMIGEFGQDMPVCLAVREHLATVFSSQHKDAQAEAEQRMVLDGRLRWLGREHPDILAARNGLGLALEAQKKFKEAQREFQQVHAIRKLVLKPDDPLVLESAANLAFVLAAQAEFGGMQDLVPRALPIAKRVLKPDHPTRQRLEKIQHQMDLK